MAERKDYKAKHAVEDQKTMIKAMVSGFGSFFGQQIAERKYKLIEINLHQTQHPNFAKAYLAPVSLSHVMIDKNNLVMLVTKSSYSPIVEITMQEWERIRLDFGYSDPTKPSLENLINAECSPEKVDTE